MSTLHVQPWGDDTIATGSEDRPFRTVSQAKRHARVGDELFVHEGLYVDAPGPMRVPVAYRAAAHEPDALALLEASEPPRREIGEYALAARTTLERELVRALKAERDRVREAIWLDAFNAAMRPLQGRLGRAGLHERLPTHGRPVYAMGDEIVTNTGENGTITAPPNEKRPHTALVAMNDGSLWDLPLSQFRPRSVRTKERP